MVKRRLQRGKRMSVCQHIVTIITVISKLVPSARTPAGLATERQAPVRRELLLAQEESTASNRRAPGPPPCQGQSTGPNTTQGRSAQAGRWYRRWCQQSWACSRRRHRRHQVELVVCTTSSNRWEQITGGGWKWCESKIARIRSITSRAAPAFSRAAAAGCEGRPLPLLLKTRLQSILVCRARASSTGDCRLCSRSSPSQVWRRSGYRALKNNNE